MAFWSNFFKGKTGTSGLKNARNALAPHNKIMSHYKEVDDMLGSMSKGGKIKKTGMYRLHQGERVLSKRQELARKMRK